MNVISRTSLLLAPCVTAATLAAQPPQGGRLSRGDMPYDPTAEVTVRGMVQEVRSMRDVVTVTHLVVNADHATTVVHLGPSSWVAAQTMSFHTGDEVEIIGSHGTYDDPVTDAASDVVVARQIRKGGETMTLRDSQGISEWSRGR